MAAPYKKLSIRKFAKPVDSNTNESRYWKGFKVNLYFNMGKHVMHKNILFYSNKLTYNIYFLDKSKIERNCDRNFNLFLSSRTI